MRPLWMYLFGAVSSQHNVKSLRSPYAITPSRNLGLVQSPCDFAKLEPFGAHSLDLAWYLLLMIQGHQQTPPISVDVIAELVAVGRRAESDP